MLIQKQRPNGRHRDHPHRRPNPIGHPDSHPPLQSLRQKIERRPIPDHHNDRRHQLAEPLRYLQRHRSRHLTRNGQSQQQQGHSRRIATPYPASGSLWNSTLSRSSKASANRSSIGIVGIVPPASNLATAGCFSPARSANSAWVRPSSSLRCRTATPSSNLIRAAS
ncbi:hypothetical protein NSERUTF1_2857 [Nocardia seriolae]|nr:hypothetical protein NSERUTF1_2857 [Nocardia seriolae]